MVSRPNTSRGWISISYPFPPLPPCFSFLIHAHPRSVTATSRRHGEAASFFPTFELRSSPFCTCVISYTREWDLCEIHLCRASVLQPDRPSSSTKYVGIGWCTLHIDIKIDQNFFLFLFLLYIYFFKKFFKRLLKIHLIFISFFTSSLFYGYYMTSYSIEKYRIISTFSFNFIILFLLFE